MTATLPPAGAPIWNDVSTSDLERTVAFYTGLFGWTHLDYGEEFGHYGAFLLDGSVVAGVGPNPGGFPDMWTVYLHSPDAAATGEAIAAAGGRVVAPAMQVGDSGTMLVAADPSGAVFGLWQPGQHTGFAVWGRPGAPAWHELHTRDFAAVRPFYESALGWRSKVTADSDEFRYLVDEVADTQYAGIFDASRALPQGAPSVWVVYLAAADVDDLVARAVADGASVTDDPEDTPFGRLAGLVDPTGATFKVIGPNLETAPA